MTYLKVSVGDKRNENGHDLPVTVAPVLEAVFGCKWSVLVLSAIADGTVRPGALQRAIPGISAKVLHERLAKLVRLGLLERVVHAAVPPHVEYRLTPRGLELADLLARVRELERRWAEEDRGRQGPAQP
ncbi:putative HTH-type transcriptional regulator YtcD [bacterium HR39]|nr:putative HTH-type transcriptional regulator YtcD [bacterium HR39]